jgi:hypothetical protein
MPRRPTPAMAMTQLEALTDESERVVRRGLKQGLRAAVANLYRVYASPGSAGDRDAAFLRGLEESVVAYERALRLIERQEQA